MARIIPFKGLRPTPQLAELVATLPYDVLNVAEARRFQDKKYNFYHCTRSEIDLPESVEVHSQAVYEKARTNLNQFIKDGVLVQDATAHYYIYRLTMNGKSQTGLIAASSVADYEQGLIKKHELTRPVKEQDRIDHIDVTEAQTGVVLLTYREVPALTRLLADWVNQHAAVCDFVSEDGVRHEFWVIEDAAKNEEITQLFAKEVPATYIADGHHRAASAYKVAMKRRKEAAHPNPEAAYNYFLTAIFPSNQMHILDYNRVVKDLNGLSDAEFLQRLEEWFTLSKVEVGPYRPDAKWKYGLYLNKTWYCMELKEHPEEQLPLTERLDVSVLQNLVLKGILAIDDPRTNDRVDFVGGIRGLQALADRVDEGDMVAAFSCYPVTLDELLAVADSGSVMPPKSTWFEPKTRDGLIVHLINPS